MNTHQPRPVIPQPRQGGEGFSAILRRIILHRHLCHGIIKLYSNAKWIFQITVFHWFYIYLIAHIICFIMCFRLFSFKLAFCFMKMILISIFISVTEISVYMILFEYISDMNIDFADSDSIIIINYQEWFFHSAPSSRRPCWGLLETGEELPFKRQLQIQVWLRFFFYDFHLVVAFLELMKFLLALNFQDFIWSCLL